MKLMAEDERLMMLEELSKTKKELNNALQSMPISMKTDSLRKKKLDLE